MPTRRTALLPLIATAALGLAACSNDNGRPAGTPPAGTAIGGSSSHGTPAGTTAGGSKAPGSITIMAGGDVFTNELPMAQAKKDAGGNGYDFVPMLAGLKPLVSKADLAICQLETPLTKTNTNLGYQKRHNSPYQLATALKDVGFDGCSFANNHTYDAGLSGMKQTREIMTSNGLQLAGPLDSADEPANSPGGQVAWYQAKGFKVAQLSYTYSADNLQLGNMTHTPSDAPFFKQNLFMVRGAQGIIDDAKAVRAEGADLVIVSMHWRTEHKMTNDDDNAQMAAEIAKSGAVNWIVGNHPHVVHGCERIDNMIVNYSLGNELSDMGTQWGFPPQSQDGIAVEVTFTRDANGKITPSAEKYQPTWVDRTHGYRIYIVPKSGGSAAIDPTSYGRTEIQIHKAGNSCDLTAIS